MRFKIVKRLLFYGFLTGIYFMGYCKGYDDCKHKRNGFEKLYNEKKEVVLDSLDTVTDSAYSAIKKMIKENRGEKE